MESIIFKISEQVRITQLNLSPSQLLFPGSKRTAKQKILDEN
jgi:hypothetical protein